MGGVDENCSVSLREVLVVDAIPLKAAQMPVSSESNHLEHLKDISFKELSDKTIGLLIGVDASVVFRALESIFGPEGTLCYQKFFWMGAVWPSSSLSVLPRRGE